MEILIQAGQLILSLSILILLHEMGHFIPARLFKTRVEKFYLFFDPYFSLFKIKKGETEYGIGWLPLGGYVKISGMIDESMDKEQMKLPPQPWEFRSKPAWQRLIIMAGGVTVNVILGILIYSMVLYTWGEKYLPAQNAKYGIATDSLAMQMGLMDEDKILAVDNIPVTEFNKIPIDIILNKAQAVQVERDGEKISIPVKEEILSQLIKGKNSFIEPLIPSDVDTILPKSEAEKAGLKKGDKIMSINGVETPFYQQVVRELRNLKNKPLSIVVMRKDSTQTINAKLDEKGKLGFGPRAIDEYFEYNTRTYGFFESFPAGIKRGVETLDNYLKQIKFIFTVSGAHESIGGFYTISKAFGTEWNWQRFWSFTAFISIVLAFMNLLPIPALDGGYIMFLLFEMITRIKVPDKVIEYANYVGFFLLMSLMLYANTDFLRH